MLAVLAELTTADEREGVEKFVTVGGLAEWKRTTALTRGAEQLGRTVRNFVVSVLLSANVDGAAAAALRHLRSHQDPACSGSNPAQKVFQTFQPFRFRGILQMFQEVGERSMASIGWHE